MILLLDNYDSFVYNLDRYLRRLGQSTLVVRSDSITVDSISRLNISAILISPGPKAPNDAGCSLEVIRKLGKHVPILGVCLGHQAIGQAFGANVVRAPLPYHGKISVIEHNRTGLFRELPSPTKVGRYHSRSGFNSGLLRGYCMDCGWIGNGGSAPRFPYSRFAVPSGVHPYRPWIRLSSSFLELGRTCV